MPTCNVTDDERDAIWWSCVAEPSDTMASQLRHLLGDHEARQWASAQKPGALPAAAYATIGAQEWTTAWKRWYPRASNVSVDQEMMVLERIGGGIVTASNPRWPQGVADLGHWAPRLLWVLGQLPLCPMVAVVGARASSPMGEQTARDLSVDLASRGFGTISGGAFGIDAAAHRGSLDAGAPTVAYMAGGIGVPYPQAHRELFSDIVRAGGAIVSEVPPSWRPARWRFLARNRLIAAASNGIVVVEAALRSGALATARQGMEIGREVGAVPGPVTATMSQGCHELIRNGATLIRHAADIAEMLAPYHRAIQEHEAPIFGMPVEKDHGVDALPIAQRRVWDALPARSGCSTDTLVNAAGLSRQEVLAALARLELSGWVCGDPRGWRRAPQRSRRGDIMPKDVKQI
ncbi:DNA-processing protein DprA [Schaalia suimastitidis]|uniref:DNA-processing protein DprA n=1 Tax=Schaalia suimastitidis TaxID=121163 RepID=UPI0004112CEB|nr:DNA-processing protein DprA [Schaalia suimastitidis]